MKRSRNSEEVQKQRKISLVGVNKEIGTFGARKFPILNKSPGFNKFWRTLYGPNRKLPSFIYYYSCMVCDDDPSKYENEYSARWYETPKFHDLLLNENCYSLFNKTGLFKEASEAGGVLHLMDEYLDEDVRKSNGKGYHIFDIGGGKGILSLLLSTEFPEAKIHLVDLALKGKMNKKHFESFPDIQLHPLRLGVKEHNNQDIVSLKSLIDENVNDDEKVIILGIHLCTDLGEHFLDTFIQCEKISAAILSPCCIRKHERNIHYFKTDEAVEKSYPSELPRSDQSKFSPYERWSSYLYDKLHPLNLKVLKMARLVKVLSMKDIFIVATRDVNNND